MTTDPLGAANALADVLARENEALRRLDFPAAVALLPSKQAALLGISQCLTPPMGKERNQTLTALGRRVNSLAAENRTLLERAITVQTRILGIIMRTAAPPPAPQHYSANGYQQAPRRGRAVALSERA